MVQFGAFWRHFLYKINKSFSVCLEYISREPSPKKLYKKYLNNIDNGMLRTIAIGTGASSNITFCVLCIAVTADTDGGAYSPLRQSSSYSLTTLSSSSSTDRRAETDRIVITTRIAVAHHFRCRLRRRESCILGATSSQPTLPLHELPPARLVIHRQTSAHKRRIGR